MARRFLAFLSALAFLSQAPAAGQAPPVLKAASAAKAASGKSWTPPRTPDGVPDLQGIWTNFNSVPLQRPKELGAKEFYTEQEHAEMAKRGFQGDRVQAAEVHYDLAQFGLASDQEQVVPNLRTSLIVGPDGRIPP